MKKKLYEKQIVRRVFSDFINLKIFEKNENAGNAKNSKNAKNAKNVKNAKNAEKVLLRF
jgi:hypothetical protein